jgi:hypothetical protein
VQQQRQQMIARDQEFQEMRHQLAALKELNAATLVALHQLEAVNLVARH